MLVTRLWIDHQIGNADNPDISLTKEDYYYVLHPIENNHKAQNKLLLMMHDKVNTPESKYMEKFQTFLKNNKTAIPDSDWNNFKLWVKPGEQKILKAFFQSELFILKKLPDWLS